MRQLESYPLRKQEVVLPLLQRRITVNLLYSLDLDSSAVCSILLFTFFRTIVDRA